MVLADVAAEGEADSGDDAKREKAIVIFEKKPFGNDSSNWSKLIDSSDLRFIVQNDIYGNYDALVPSDLNGSFPCCVP